MVCLMCLIPLFLVPIVNVLPLLFFYLMGKVYGILGWEYKKPEMAPPACPFKPGTAKKVGLEAEPGVAGHVSTESIAKPVAGGDDKQD